MAKLNFIAPDTARLLRLKMNRKAKRYAVIFEMAKRNYSAYVPDLPGCVGTGTTLRQVEKNIREAIAFHLDGLRADGLRIPPPRTKCEYVDAKVS